MKSGKKSKDNLYVYDDPSVFISASKPVIQMSAQYELELIGRPPIERMRLKNYTLTVYGCDIEWDFFNAKELSNINKILNDWGQELLEEYGSVHQQPPISANHS